MMLKNPLTSALLFALIFFTSLSASSQSQLVKSIYFKTKSFSIDKKYEPALNHIAQQLSSDSFGYLKVFAFTDTRGTEDYNDILSEKRAKAVYNYLTSHAKFDTTKVYITWLGESADIYDLHFPKAHKQQKCVDIWVQFYRKPK